MPPLGQPKWALLTLGAVPSTRRERLITKLYLSVPWRTALPDRTVRRRVQGVEMLLPWSHPLPDYARSRPTYGQNLIELAARLNAAGGPGTAPLQVLDVGANIGDSAKQILARTDATVLCVEGDPYWVRYLHMNVDGLPEVRVEDALLSDQEAAAGDVTAVRAGGTTRFVEGQAEDAALPVLSVSALRARHPEFAQLRLVKCDTDGWDPLLVPAIAEAWQDTHPVLFFEFDPTMARDVGVEKPNDVWARLADLGYGPVAVWDNGADPLGRFDIADALTHSAGLDPRPVHLGYHFWDVAVCHRDDTRAQVVLDALFTDPYDPQGIRRRSPGTSPGGARVARARYDLRRVAQTPRTFANWPTLLGQMLGERIGHGPERLEFVTRSGARLSCPNVPGARLPLYEQWADDSYRVAELLAPLQGRPIQVLDIGAHVGSFAINVATRHPGARVECYEPSAQSAEYLRRNIAANGLDERVIAHEAALADREGTALLDDNAAGSVHNGLVQDDGRLVAGAENLDRRHRVAVRTTTFDAAVAAAPSPPDIVKMDCEGGEYALVYASSPQSWASVSHVVMEYHPVAGQSWDELRSWLGRAGLTVARHQPIAPGLGTAWLVREPS